MADPALHRDDPQPRRTAPCAVFRQYPDRVAAQFGGAAAAGARPGADWRADLWQLRLHLAAADFVPVRNRRSLDPASRQRRARGGGDNQAAHRDELQRRAVLRRSPEGRGNGVFGGGTGGRRLWLQLFACAGVGKPDGRGDRGRGRSGQVRACLGRIAGCRGGDRQSGHGHAGDRAALARPAA